MALGRAGDPLGVVTEGPEALGAAVAVGLHLVELGVLEGLWCPAPLLQGGAPAEGAG